MCNTNPHINRSYNPTVDLFFSLFASSTSFPFHFRQAFPTKMTSLPWPPPSGLHTHNVPANSAILVSYSSIHIDAPGEKVFDALRRVGNYGKWNAFAPIARIETKGAGNEEAALLEVGDVFVYEVIMVGVFIHYQDLQIWVGDSLAFTHY